jgi:5-methylcytosine-specific restriction endonuclease McrA
LSFTLDVTPEADVDVTSKAEPISLIEQLEKQKMEIELKLQEEKRLLEEKALQEEKRLLEEKALQEEKRLQEEKALQDIKEKKAKDEETLKLKEEEDKREAKKKKQSIPKNVRVIVWNHYIGEDIIKHKCLCCKKVTISNTNFEVGHVLSEKCGGTHEINNLRPICFSCNHSMGSENMIDFVVKFGLYIG